MSISGTDAGRGDGSSQGAKCAGLGIAVLAVLVLLGAHVGYLQLVQTDELAVHASRQQDYMMYVPGERGSMYDRKGVLLARSVPRYDLALRIEQVRDPRDSRRRTLDKVCTEMADLGSYLGPTFYQARPSREDVLRHIRLNTPLPFTLWRGLDNETTARWAARRADFPGTETTLAWKREYYVTDTTFHVRGFCGYDQPAVLPDFPRLHIGTLELRGRDGIEDALDASLRGDGGYELLRTDVMAFRREVTHRHPARRGEDCRISIDTALQSRIEALFRDDGLVGALVILDAKTGEVLAAVSEPSPGIPPAKDVPEGANVNRVVAGYYPPGSTLKPLVAMAALRAGVVTPVEEIKCRGGYELPNGHVVSCSSRWGHGPISMERALATSCNTYFCELAVRLGRRRISTIGAPVGFGKKLQTELWRQEIPGILYCPEWAREKRRNNPQWALGDSANAGIGQGAWIVTPLQLAVGITAVVTGKLVHPTFLHASEYAQPSEDLGWPEEMRQVVKNGMRACVESGTGKRLQMLGVDLLGKTGTAQVGHGRRSNALCVAAYPGEDPNIVGVCVLEHAGSGGKEAAPVLRLALIMTMAAGYGFPEPVAE